MKKIDQVWNHLQKFPITCRGASKMFDYDRLSSGINVLRNRLKKAGSDMEITTTMKTNSSGTRYAIYKLQKKA